ncbi:Zinc/iron permease [Microthyrium microscopicum]|uniref:Zinc/iron permease n=1 Tax=Microthyrium microscopicum TaxID=703497 RepID=A0A6A6UTD0_9PEZI|nr:Zinc/iron permease [Microthyrium microscopicum]
MADGPLMLLILSAIMATSSFLAGMLPLSLSLSQRQLRIITALGSGILIGTALVIIIPEGIETLYAHHEITKRATSKDEHDDDQNSSVVGISLVFGFALMYLIDVLPPLTFRQPSADSHIPLTSLDGEPLTPYKSPAGQSHAHATTIGLLIHSFADGIALGASSSVPAVGLVVFAAIMLHKAPVAFGLTTALLKDGVNKRAVRGHLVLFSLAAPMGAFVTWAFIQLLAGGKAGSTFWTGVALIFSGGTFLYVAMHSMQSSNHNGGGEASLQKADVLYTLVGMLLPLLTRIGHGHAHGH